MRVFLLSICLLISHSSFAQLDLVNEDERQLLEQKLSQCLLELKFAEDKREGYDSFTALVNLGDLYRSNRNYSKAIDYYQQSKAYANPAEEPEKFYLVQSGLARVLFANAQYEDVIETLEEIDWEGLKGLLYYDKYDSDELLARALVQLGELSDARRIFEGMHEGALINIQDTVLAIEALVNASEVSNDLGQYKESLSFLSKTDALVLSCGTDPNVDIFLNRAKAYNKLGRSKEAIRELLDAESLGLAYNAEIQKQIAQIYLNLNKKKEALVYANKAIDNALLRDDVAMLLDLYAFRGGIEYLMKDYKKNLISVEESSKFIDKVRTNQITKDSRRLRIQDFMINVENSRRQETLEGELRASEIKEAELKEESDRLKEERTRLQQEKQEQALALLEERAAVNAANLKTAELDRRRIEQEAKTLRQLNKTLEIERDLEKMAAQSRTDSLIAAEKEFKAQSEIERYQVNEEKAAFEAAEKESTLKKNRLLAIIFGLGLLVAGGLWFNTRRLNKQLASKNIKIEEQRVLVEKERQRAEQLLLNVLPKSIAEELKNKGVAAPEKYDSATVLFTDFVGFTAIASSLAPEEIIEELNYCFTEFDEIADRHRIEKIKTIGDSYMCAGGIPDANSTHPSDAVKAGQDMIAFMNKRNAEHKRNGKTLWPIRIGIHTGELVAGVVGSSKFAYDIWGDTVNVASRMERGAEHDSINVSEETYQLIKDHFDCQFRGEIDVKNKGLMGMYRVG